MSHDRKSLIEEVVGSRRDRDAHGRVQPHPAWFDLSEEDRVDAFEQTFAQRQLEAATHPAGLSATARAVLDRIRR